MKKGIFWCKNFDTGCPELVVVSVACDRNGNTEEPAEFSSKSGANFNHKLEWSKLDKNVTEGHPFNYYPRGRVEIKSGKATVFINPVLNKETVTRMISDIFELTAEDAVTIKFKSDGSKHYQFICGNS